MENKNWKDILTKEASVEEVLKLMSRVFRFLARRLVRILSVTLVFGVLAFLIGLIFYQPKQKAVYIIATEEETVSGFEGLMAQFGMDVGGSNPGGVFSGENLVQLFRIRSMIERALLNPVNYKGEDMLYADVFFRSTKHAKKKLFKPIKFNIDRSLHDKLTDSALYLTYEYVRDEVLGVSKPEKKIGFILVSVIHDNPDIAIGYSKTTIKTVTDFYVESQTMKARQNLDVLRFEADSVRNVLNKNLQESASESDLNVNPLWQSMRVEQNKSMIDLQISVSLFGEIIKNLKLAEISLRKQTPLIQVIETPRYPLKRVGYKPWQIGLIGALLGFLLALYFALRQFGISEKKQA